MTDRKIPFTLRVTVQSRKVMTSDGDIGERQAWPDQFSESQRPAARRGGLTRRDLALLPVVIGAMASGRAEAEAGLAVENASLADVAQALAQGRSPPAPSPAPIWRASKPTTGPAGLNSVREVNPDALAIAGSSTA